MNFRNLPLVLAAALTALSLSSSAQWNPVGATNFAAGAVSRTSLTIAKGDTPVMAFRDNSVTGGGKLTVMKYYSSTWISLGNTGYTTNRVAEVSVAADTAANKLYVAYIDTFDGIHVDLFDGANTWSAVGSTGFVSNVQATGVKLRIAGDGTPYILYNDGNQSYKANVMKYSGGSWQQVGSSNFSAVSDTYNDLALDHNGTPYVISAASSFPEEVQVQKFDGSGWVNVGAVGFDTAEFATPVAIAIDANNQPYVALTYHDDHYPARVWHFNGTSWSKVGAQPITPTYSQDLQLVVSKLNTPVLSYVDYDVTYKASVKAFNGVSWVQLGPVNFTGGEADFSALAINSAGDLFLGYEDYANGNGATVLEYLHNVGIHDVVGIAGFNLYPNPNSGKFMISFKAVTAGGVQLSMTNMIGQKVWEEIRTGNSGQESVDLTGIAKGLYALQVKTETGTENRLVEVK